MGLSAFVKSIYANNGTSGVAGTVVRRAAAADPQNVWQTLFTIANGEVLVTSITGIRTVIQAGGASQMQFRHSVGPTVLDTGGLVITGQAIGAVYSVTGNPNDPISVGLAGAAVQGGLSGSQAVVSIQQLGLLMTSGNIQVTMTAAAGTGSTRYMVTYIPLDAGASLVAV